MNFEIIEIDAVRIAEVHSGEVVVRTVQDAIDLIANADYQGARSVLIHADQLTPEFFDLRSGLAGEILQKCANYRFKLAIVGDFTVYESKALQAFIIECNRGKHIFFESDKEAARKKIISD